jgi:hypothetical protein
MASMKIRNSFDYAFKILPPIASLLLLEHIARQYFFKAHHENLLFTLSILFIIWRTIVLLFDLIHWKLFAENHYKSELQSELIINGYPRELYDMHSSASHFKKMYENGFVDPEVRIKASLLVNHIACHRARSFIYSMWLDSAALEIVKSYAKITTIPDKDKYFPTFELCQRKLHENGGIIYLANTGSAAKDVNFQITESHHVNVSIEVDSEVLSGGKVILLFRYNSEATLFHVFGSISYREHYNGSAYTQNFEFNPTDFSITAPKLIGTEVETCVEEEKGR